MDKNKGKKKRQSQGLPATKPNTKTATIPGKVEEARIPWKTSTLFWIHLGILFLLLFMLRINLMDLPLERDESAYAYLGKRAIEGLAPYRDFYEMKPPFLFYGYGLLNLIFGYSWLGLRLIAWMLTLCMGLGVYLLGRSFFGAKYGLLAALMLVLFSANPYSTMVFAESELLVMSLTLFGIWFLYRALNQEIPTKQERWWLIGAGFLIGSGVMIKQSAIFFLGFAAVMLILMAEGEHLRTRIAKFIQAGLWFSLGAIVPVLVCLVIIFGFGVWEDFAFWNLEYPSLYTNSTSFEDGFVQLKSNFNNLIQNQVILWVLGVLGLMAVALKGLSRKMTISLLALVLFSFMAIVPGRRFYLHYWIQFLPAVALLIAHLFFKIEKLGQKPSLGLAKNLSFPLAILCLLVGIVTSSAHWSKIDSATLTRNIFGGNPFVVDQLFSRIIESRIQPDEKVAALGSEPQVYVYLNRKAPSRHFYVAFLSRQNRFTESWHAEALDGLKKENPEYIVFYIVTMSWMLRPDSNQGFYQNAYSWVMQNYTPIAWADYIDYYNPTIVTDAAAATYKPLAGNYVILLKKK